MQFAKKIRYRSRFLLVLALLAPCLGIVSLDVASASSANESLSVLPLHGVKQSSVRYEIDKRQLPQGMLFTVVPITSNKALNDELKKFTQSQVVAFTNQPAVPLFSGIMPQLTVTPMLDYIADDAFSVSMQVEIYKTNQDVAVATTSWIGDATTVKQIVLTDELASSLKTVAPNLSFNSNLIGKNLTFGVLPDQRIRFYNDSEPYTAYSLDMTIPKSSKLGEIIHSYFFKNYPAQISPEQKKSLHKSYTKFLDNLNQKTNCSNVKCISLTFDDGPSPDVTPKVLDILKKYQVKATFFELGMQVEKYPEIAKSVLSQGHEIQNHSYNHPDFVKIKNVKVIKEQIDKTDSILKQIGANPTMIRPPYGSYTNQIQSIVSKPFVLWNVDAQEWRASTTSEKIQQQINARARQGAIILMHDTRDQTPANLDLVIRNLLQRGYKVVTVSEQIQATMQSNGRYYSGQ